MNLYSKILENNTEKKEYNYQDEIPYKTRCIDSENIVRKHPNCVPVIINTKENIDMKRKKFLVSYNINSTILIYHIRKHISNAPCNSIFLFHENTIIDNLKNIGDMYLDYILTNKSDDKYFYLNLCFENTFG